MEETMIIVSLEVSPNEIYDYRVLNGRGHKTIKRIAFENSAKANFIIVPFISFALKGEAKLIPTGF